MYFTSLREISHFIEFFLLHSVVICWFLGQSNRIKGHIYHIIESFDYIFLWHHLTKSKVLKIFDTKMS